MAEISQGKTEESDASNSDEKILEQARARFKLAEEAETEIRRLAREDLAFRAGEQWHERDKANRETDGRPCLVINKVDQAVNQVTNDQRQNRPSLRVHPVDDKADIETAKVIQGITRNIEANSNADVAYDTAFDSAATCGFGFWRVITDYVSPDSFDQEIKIKRIRDRFQAYLDPRHQEPDGSDAEWGFVFEWVTKSDYKNQNPNSDLGKGDDTDWAISSSITPDWVKDDSVLIAEYFYKEYEEKTIHLLDSGDIVFEEDLEQILQNREAQGAPSQVVKTRKTSVPTVKWCKLTGTEVLEKTDWPGKYIPIVPVYGSELVVDGKLILKGLVRNSMDPARMYNYWASAETEAIALAPRAPYLVAEGQIEGYEAEWETANRKNHAYLTYKSTDSRGQPVGPPQRNAFDPAVQAITQARMLASDDIKATTGIYDAALGAKSNETSGTAINSRKLQSQTSSYHFVDNLTRSIRHTGKIIIDLIPKIYDTARAARIIGEDGEQKVVKVNTPFEENGKQVLYALDAGKYDVTVDVGPSFQSKRQEAAQFMQEMVRSYPPTMQVAGDLVVKSMDVPGAQELSERFKKTLPPNLIDDPKNQANQIPPQVQQQMQQMNQMVEQLTNQLHAAHDAIDQKKIELESKERIEFAKLDTQLKIALAQIDAKDSLALLGHQMSEIKQRLQLVNIGQPIGGGSQPQSFTPQPTDGGQSASQFDEAPQPTGGQSPGSPMEGFQP